MGRAGLSLGVLTLAACAAKPPPITDMTTIAAADLAAAVNVRVFTTQPAQGGAFDWACERLFC
jgi:hypothetical protein